MMMGGLCKPLSLAKAGLLDGKHATIHWKIRIVLAKNSRKSSPDQIVFVVDSKPYDNCGRDIPRLI